MSVQTVSYLRLQDGDAFPVLNKPRPFKAIVVIESEVSQLWQWDASRWLVASGCRYMMAWGTGCDAWDEAVDEANLEAFNYEDIPESDHVMTTSHEDEDLSEVFWFARHSAGHSAHQLDETLILHISDTDKRKEFEEMYRQG